MNCSESELIKEYNDIEENIISEEFNRVKSNVFEFILFLLRLFFCLLKMYKIQFVLNECCLLCASIWIELSLP